MFDVKAGWWFVRSINRFYQIEPISRIVASVAWTNDEEGHGIIDI